MKYTAIAFALFSAIGASASASSGTADDRDVIIRNLVNKVDILSSELEEQKAKVEAQDAWRTELVSSLKHVKAAAGIAPQDKTSVRRNLREAAVEPQYTVLGEILYELVSKVEKIKETVELVHECLDYDHNTNSCLLGDGSSISSVAISAGTIHLESTATGDMSTGIGLTSASRIDCRAETNVNITSETECYIGTNPDGDITQDAGLQFNGNWLAIYAANSIDIASEATNNIQVRCGSSPSSENDLCPIDDHDHIN